MRILLNRHSPSGCCRYPIKAQAGDEQAEGGMNDTLQIIWSWIRVAVIVIGWAMIVRAILGLSGIWP